jgi:hypothetical protein
MNAESVSGFIVHRSSILVFLAALLLYGLTPLLGGNFHHQELAYFSQLAEAALHGQLYLPNPDGTHDLILYQGRWYVPFPPGPALLLLPFVAVWGVGFNEVLLSVAVGALNVVLMHRLLRALAARGLSRLELRGQLWLTALFAAGTAHWYAAPTGTVSFLAHICAVTGLTAALWLATEQRSPWLVGLAMAWALLCRPTLILATPAVLALLLTPSGDARQPVTEGGRTAGRTAGAGAIFAAPLALAIGLLLAYNAARFGSPLEFGYGWAQTQAPHLAERLATWGQFSPHYLAENLRVALLGLPLLRPRPPFIWPDPNGMSVLLVTPVFFWLVHARQRNWVVAASWLSLALVSVPLLLYYNTGWVQFGYRFSLDILPLAFLLLAIGLQRITPLVKAAIVLAWLINLWGVVWWFGRFY